MLLLVGWVGFDGLVACTRSEDYPLIFFFVPVLFFENFLIVNIVLQFDSRVDFRIGFSLFLVFGSTFSLIPSFIV